MIAVFAAERAIKAVEVVTEDPLPGELGHLAVMFASEGEGDDANMSEDVREVLRSLGYTK